ncbi:MAG: hypothetical protein C1943_17775 [Halochromatium sp.]|nr:hypothetical protein [Halochromatium sp.]
MTDNIEHLILVGIGNDFCRVWQSGFATAPEALVQRLPSTKVKSLSLSNTTFDNPEHAEHSNAASQRA